MKKTTFLIVLFYSSFLFSQTFNSGDFRYTVTSATIPTTVEVSGYLGTGGDVSIPATVQNNGIVYRITHIGESAFENKSLTSITFQSSVTSIGDSAFKDNALTSFSINANITSIGNNVFQNNSLTSITIPDSVTSIGEFAFNNNSLISVTIPNSVTTLKKSAFRKNSITNVTIPNSITTIENFVFSENSLTSIVIPSNITSIGGFAFSNNSLTNVSISNSVTTIKQNAFRTNFLKDVTIPANVTSMEDNVFGNNPITGVTSKSLTPAFLPSNTFDNNGAIILTIPTGTRTAYTNQNWIDFRFINEDPTLSTNTTTFLEDNISIDNYTNPDYITISATNAINVQSIEVFGISGVKILSSTQSQIAIAPLANGVYIMQIITNKGKFSKKFAK